MLNSLYLLWQLVRPHLALQRRLLLLALFMTVLATATGLLAPWMLKRIIDTDLPAGDMQMFVISVLKAGAAYLVAYSLWASQQAVAALATERIFLAVKNQLLEQLLDQPRCFFDRLPDAEIAMRLNSNLRDASVTFRDDVIAGIVEILATLGLLGAVLATHWQTGLFLTLALSVYVLLIALVDKPLRSQAWKARDARSAQNALFLDVLAASRDIRIFNLSRKVQDKFSQLTLHVAGEQIILARFSAVLRNGFGLIGALLTLGLIAVSGKLIIEKDYGMSIGLLIALLAIVLILVTTLNQLMLRMGRLIEAEPSLRRVVDLMQSPQLQTNRAVLPPLATVKIKALADKSLALSDIPDTATIDFKDVSYGRSDGPLVLKNFSLQIAAGEKVAIMGSSGSGKSSLLDLLMRLREPSSGSILYSGIDIRQIAPDLYYSAFGFVGQNSHIMRLSLREFLMQGWPGQIDADLWRVLRLVHMRAAVEALPLQLDTLIGTGEWGFASGQHQRLMVARALVRDPQVLILDEFTSTLDAATEAALVTDVLRECPGRTVICTTFSPLVAGLFDRVVVLPGGS